MKKMKMMDLILCAMFAALSAVLSQVMVPIGPVPITLTHLSVFIGAGLLGAKYGAVSQAVFVLLGAVGVPVFSGFSGGIGIVLGPKGGFIIGYIACAFAAGLIIERYGNTIPRLILAMAVGMMVTYVLGITWYIHITKTGFVAALMACVVPFLIGDAIKIALSSVLVNRLSPILVKPSSTLI